MAATLYNALTQKKKMKSFGGTIKLSNNYSCTIWIQSNIWFLRKLMFSFTYGPMLKFCLATVAILDFRLTKNKVFRRPYKEQFRPMCGFGEEDLWNVSQSESIIGTSGHIMKIIKNIRTNQVKFVSSLIPTGPVVCEKYIKMWKFTDDGHQMIAIVHLTDELKNVTHPIISTPTHIV